MTAEDHTTEAAVVAALTTELIEGALRPFLIEAPEGRTLAAIPNGSGDFLFQDITSANKADVLMPKHVTQAVQLQDANSLIEYVNRFKNFDSVLFANIVANDILAVIDYHKMPNANVHTNGTPTLDGTSFDPSARLNKHTAMLHMPFSIEWQTWIGIDGKLMSHVEFATFLEENAMDIMPLPKLVDGSGAPVEDAPTTLLELCRELQVRGSYGANSAVRSGDYTNVEFQKGDDVSTKRNVALPLSINLVIPVYFGEQAVPVTAFMRRKVDDGALRLGIKLMRPENVRQDEFHRIVGTVATSVELTTLYGKPA